MTLSEEDKNLMSAMIPILTSFEKTIENFEASKVPTIQHVLPTYKELTKDTDPKVGEHEAIRELRSRLKKQLEQNFYKKISMRHKLGAFFWPRLIKSLGPGILPEEETAEVRPNIFLNSPSPTFSQNPNFSF